MKYYLQVNDDNIIKDCIDYPHPGYVEYEGNIYDPVHGGWFRLEAGVIVEYPELKPVVEEPLQVE